MDDVMTNNFEIMVKGKQQTYLVHSRMKKNHKLFKEESPEHLEMVKKAIKDIMNGKEPTLPESRKKEGGKGSKSAEEREAEAKARAEEQARKKEETEKKRKELQATRDAEKKEAEAAEATASITPVITKQGSKSNEKKKTARPSTKPSTKKDSHNKKAKVEAVEKVVEQPKDTEIVAKDSSRRSSINMKATENKPSAANPLASDPSSISTSAGSTNSSAESMQERTKDEHPKVEKALDIVGEDPGDSTQQFVAQEEAENALKATRGSDLQQQRDQAEKEAAHDSQISSKELSNADGVNSPALAQETDIYLQSKAIAQQAKLESETKVSPPSSIQKSSFFSFFEFACCRSASTVDDRRTRDFEDHMAQPEVDACFVAA